MSATYAVVCDDYTIERKTREAAERALADIETLGACTNEHHIEERQ